MGWVAKGNRGDNESAQLLHPWEARSFTKSCRLCWNSSTDFAETIHSGNKLYTPIKPKADLIIKLLVDLEPRTSTRWNRCLCAAVTSARLKNCLKCGGPFPNTERWMTPSNAMSRRVDRGAKWKWKSALSSSTPASLRKRFWTVSNLFKTSFVAW